MTVLKLHAIIGENIAIVLIETTGMAVRPQGSGSRVFTPSDAAFDVTETPEEIYALIYPPIDG